MFAVVPVALCFAGIGREMWDDGEYQLKAVIEFRQDGTRRAWNQEGSPIGVPAAVDALVGKRKIPRQAGRRTIGLLFDGVRVLDSVVPGALENPGTTPGSIGTTEVGFIGPAGDLEVYQAPTELHNYTFNRRITVDPFKPFFSATFRGPQDPQLHRRELGDAAGRGKRGSYFVERPVDQRSSVFQGSWKLSDGTSQRAYPGFSLMPGRKGPVRGFGIALPKGIYPVQLKVQSRFFALFRFKDVPLYPTER